MAKQSNLANLQKPAKLDDVLAKQKDEYEDCMPCRLIGSAAFTGLGIYTYNSGRKQLNERELEILRSGSRFGIGARRFGLVGLSAALVGVGVYRLVN